MTAERDLLSRAREAGINLSAALTAALDAELRQHEAKKWQEENSEALEVLNHFHDEHGCLSDELQNYSNTRLLNFEPGRISLI
ncbi:TPA: antitoxin [Citrobacter freundii]|nr:antitoxin [Citrobacter freundii]